MAAGKSRLRPRRTSREPLTLFPDTPRWCPQCSRHLPRAAFNRDTRVKDGLSTRCRECHSVLQKRSRTPAVALRQSVKHLQRAYSLSPAEFEAIVAAQDGRCAICRRVANASSRGGKLYVDHCHVTGQVRSLLCHHCNTALGHADDSPERLRAMADYIERHRLSSDAT